MIKKIIYFMFLLALPLTALALDPVAPRSERAFGFFKVESPQPQSDQCTLSRLMPSSLTLSCQPNTMIKIPVGEYQVTVKMQGGYSWTSRVSVRPTEYTSVAVLGYGNLKVTSPRASDIVQVLSSDGKEIGQFQANTVKTIPTGIYDVKVKSNNGQSSLNNVRIVTDTTRELLVSYE